LLAGEVDAGVDLAGRAFDEAHGLLAMAVLVWRCLQGRHRVRERDKARCMSARRRHLTIYNSSFWR
jgi:hypothetical protein